MLLYTETQLEQAYRIDCKARTKVGEKWITLEEFRPLYEELMEHFMTSYNEGDILTDDVPEYLVDSINELLELTLILDN